jgi:hypothetical protein
MQKQQKNRLIAMSLLTISFVCSSVADPNPESGFRIRRISTGTYVFGLLDPDALVRGIDPDPSMNESRSLYQQSKILKKTFFY